MSGRVVYIAPDHPHPSGGVRAIYRNVEQLCASGVPAVVWQLDPDFRCGWFRHEAPVVGGDTFELGADDLLVVPEVLVFPRFDPAPGAKKVIFNRNYFRTFDHWDDPAGYPGWDPVPHVWTTSSTSVDVLTGVVPELSLHRVPVSIDTELFRPGPHRARRIAWMPRRRGGEAKLLERLLRDDERLRDVELVAIDGADERSVAEVLGCTSVFVALGEREGFGRPPAEALAAGCLVVGFPAGGGAELFEAPGAFAVPDADVLALASKAAELVLATGADELREQAREWVAGRYGVRQERDALLAAVEAARSGPGAAAVATHPLRHVLPAEPTDSAESDTQAAQAERAARAEEAARHARAELDAQTALVDGLRGRLADVTEQADRLRAELADATTQLQELAGVTGELATTRRRAAALADELRDRRAEQAAWQTAVERLTAFEETNALLAEYTRDTARLNDRLDDTIRQKMALEARVADLEASTSWRVTAPLRRVTGTLKGERRG